MRSLRKKGGSKRSVLHVSVGRKKSGRRSDGADLKKKDQRGKKLWGTERGGAGGKKTRGVGFGQGRGEGKTKGEAGSATHSRGGEGDEATLNYEGQKEKGGRGSPRRVKRNYKHKSRTFGQREGILLKGEGGRVRGVSRTVANKETLPQRRPNSRKGMEDNEREGGTKGSAQHSSVKKKGCLERGKEIITIGSRGNDRGKKGSQRQNRGRDI